MLVSGDLISGDLINVKVCVVLLLGRPVEAGPELLELREDQLRIENEE